tara:strand:- start:2460 stop:2984 length:525 start_codon:yes stop_codon:yes gene_type:complete
MNISQIDLLSREVESSIEPYVRSLEMSVGRENAADLYQESWVLLLENMHNPSGKTTLEYFKQILYRKRFQFLKTEATRRRNIPLDHGELNAIDELRDSISEDNIELKEDRASEIFEYAEKLGPNEGRTFLLHYQEGRGVREISETLGVNQRTAERYLSSARGKVRQRFSHQYNN